MTTFDFNVLKDAFSLSIEEHNSFSLIEIKLIKGYPLRILFLNKCMSYIYLPAQKIQSPSLLQFYLLPTCRPRTVQSVIASFPVVKRK